jgi:hypothetical protein
MPRRQSVEDRWGRGNPVHMAEAALEINVSHHINDQCCCMRICVFYELMQMLSVHNVKRVLYFRCRPSRLCYATSLRQIIFFPAPNRFE